MLRFILPSHFYWLISYFSSVAQSCLFATLWTAAYQVSLSITNSRILLKLMSIESVMSSNHLILSSPSPPAFNLSQHQSLFKWISSSHQVAKVLELQLQHHPSKEYSGLISFRINRFPISRQVWMWHDDTTLFLKNLIYWLLPLPLVILFKKRKIRNRLCLWGFKSNGPHIHTCTHRGQYCHHCLCEKWRPGDSDG